MVTNLIKRKKTVWRFLQRNKQNKTKLAWSQAWMLDHAKENYSENISWVFAACQMQVSYLYLQKPD